MSPYYSFFFFFFFNDTATTEIYTLSLHDALPISWRAHRPHHAEPHGRVTRDEPREAFRPLPAQGNDRRRLRRGHRDFRPREEAHALRLDAPLEGRLQPLRGNRGYRRGRARPPARPGAGRRRRARREARRRATRGAGALRRGAEGGTRTGLAAPFVEPAARGAGRKGDRCQRRGKQRYACEKGINRRAAAQRDERTEAEQRAYGKRENRVIDEEQGHAGADVECRSASEHRALARQVVQRPRHLEVRFGAEHLVDALLETAHRQRSRRELLAQLHCRTVSLVVRRASDRGTLLHETRAVAAELVKDVDGGKDHPDKDGERDRPVKQEHEGDRNAGHCASC